MSSASGSYNAVTWLLDRNVEEGRGAKLAFTDTVSELTYGDLQKQSCRVANMLRRLGVRREERVAMIMLDTVDFPSVFLGAVRAGIVPVPLNTLLTSEQYAYVLADCRARVLFVSEALLPVVKDMVGRMPDLEHVIVSGKDAHGYNKLSDELANESTSFTTAATHPDEPAFWLYSSGSTGMPKGVRHLHSNLAATAETYAKQVLGIREDDVGLSAAKLFFAYGLGNALTFPMSVGATTVLNSERPTPATMFALMNKYHPSIFFGVPTLFAAMLNDDAMKDARGGNRLRVCTSDQRQRDAAGVLHPVQAADRQVDALVLAHQHRLAVACHQRAALHHRPVLGAMEVLLQRQPVARLHHDTMHAEACAGDQGLEEPPWPVRAVMRHRLVPARGAQPVHHALHVLRPVAVHRQHRVLRHHHHGVFQPDHGGDDAVAPHIAVARSFQQHVAHRHVAVRVLAAEFPQRAPASHI